jgi:hypothetical protein
MQITVHRAAEIARVRRSIGASTYNAARLLQRRSRDGVAFVPIRSMQVLAVISADEFVFIDSAQRAWAMLAWDRFDAASRLSLAQPIEHDCVSYAPHATEAMLRLPAEFQRALLELSARLRPAQAASVLPLRAPRG